MKLPMILAAVGTLPVFAHLMDVQPDSASELKSPLALGLQMAGNHIVNLTITNISPEPVKFFKSDGPLNGIDTQDVIVMKEGSLLPFFGMHVEVITSGLEDKVFKIVPSGATVTTAIDLSRTYDLSQGGSFDMFSSATFLLAQLNSTTVSKTFSVRSETISSNVRGDEAKAARNAYLGRSVHTDFVVQDDCTAEQMKFLEKSREGCRVRTAWAYWTSISKRMPAFSRFKDYFSDDSATTRKHVADVFLRIWRECGSNSTGTSAQHCKQDNDFCTENPSVLAYAAHSSSAMNGRVHYCPFFWDAVPEYRPVCDANDRPQIMIHELAHIYGPTGDHAYGYGPVHSLNKTFALDNADSYALFAKAAQFNC